MPLSRVQPALYAELLRAKANRLRHMLAPFSPPEPQVFPSQPVGFRLRAEFRMWHDGEELDYVMFRRDDPKTPVRISDFPIASQHIQSLMPVLRDKLKKNPVLRRKLFQVEFLSCLAGEMVVTLAYHRKLDETWEHNAHALATELGERFLCLSLIGRSRGQKMVIGNDFVNEVISVHGRDYHYRQNEQAFTQPNGRVNIHMLEWACTQARKLHGDLLELYCGNGNFTLPMSRHFAQIIATEVSKASIRAARHNLLENSIENVHLLRMSAEEVIQALDGKRTFRRLDALPKSLDSYDLRTLFVDPPRSGLDEQTTLVARRFESIIYISCNPASLAENLHSLGPGHSIGQLALFDQFPYTDHMECGVVLQRS